MRTILFLSLLISSIANAYIPTGGYEGFKEPASNFASLPTVGNVPGDMRVTLSTFDTYIWDGLIWQLRSGSGGGGVSTVFGRGGSVTAQSGDYSSFYTLRSNDLSDISSPSSARTNLGLGNIDNTSDLNKPISTATQTALDAKLGLSTNPEINPDNHMGGYSYFNLGEQVKPFQDSPDESWNFFQHIVNIDPDSSGFDLGTNSNFGNIFNIGFNHQGTSDIGNAAYFNTYSNIGNGTDPISVKGLQSWLGFGNINNGVTITDSIQGFGLQWYIDSGATLANTSYFNGFYDNMNVNTTVQGYTSFSSNPHIANVANNRNVTSLNINPDIDAFTGNAGFNGIGISGSYDFNGATTGGANGININPTITNFGSSNYYNGIYSSTSNISGVGTNKWAGYFEGDVNVTGSLTFGGALSIGKLNAFATQDVVDGGGNLSSVNSLIAAINVPASATIANGDTFGINTAALISAGANSTVTSGPLGLGITGLALPAVVEMGLFSNIDYVGGAVFVINLSDGATGGMINQGYGGRAIGIPNGITTVNRWYGLWAQNPFGPMATQSWAVYAEDDPSYFEKAVKISGSVDTVSQSHFDLETENTIGAKGGVQIETAMSQPTCDANHRGLMWNIEGGTGVADIFQICQKDASNNYVWTTH